MTIEDDLSRLLAQVEAAHETMNGCGAEALGVLRAMDEAGSIPECVRDIALNILTRWRKAVEDAKRLGC